MVRFTMQINIGQAKAQWERLLDRVERGEEITIARAGKPVARLVPVSVPKFPRPLGIDQGSYKVPEDFNGPLPEDLTAAFEGRGRRSKVKQ
jgi:prevent-host-death family protein